MSKNTLAERVGIEPTLSDFQSDALTNLATAPVILLTLQESNLGNPGFNRTLYLLS